MQYDKLKVVNRFLNYDENKNMYTRFDLTINLEDEIISNITNKANYSKDRIELLKQLKNLQQTEFLEFNKKSNANILVIIESSKILDKNRFNHYFANINIYLEDNIVCLNILSELHNEDSTVEKRYYKMDNNTKEIAKKIIQDAINEQSS